MKKKTTKKSSGSSKSAMPMMAAEKSMMGGCGCCNGGCSCGDCGMCMSGCSCGKWGLTLLRLVLGAVFLYHGIGKFLAWGGTVGFFASLGFGAWLAGLVAAVETLGGLSLVLGWRIKWPAYALAVVMLVAIVWVKIVKGGAGWGQIEWELTTFAALLALAWNGPGVWSLGWCNECNCCEN